MPLQRFNKNNLLSTIRSISLDSLDESLDMNRCHYKKINECRILCEIIETAYKKYDINLYYILIQNLINFIRMNRFNNYKIMDHFREIINIVLNIKIRLYLDTRFEPIISNTNPNKLYGYITKRLIMPNIIN